MKPFPLFISLLAGSVLMIAGSGVAADEKAVADAFRRELPMMVKQSKQTSLPVAVSIAPHKGETVDLLADRRIQNRLKWFVASTVQPTSKLAQALNADEPTAIAILDADGKILSRFGPKASANDAVKQIKELGKKSREEYIETLGRSGLTVTEAKNAANGLARMGGDAAELVPLLRFKSTAVRSIVSKALHTLPVGEVVLAALDGLASDEVEMRAACYPFAALGKLPKTSPLKFWRDAPEDKRSAELATWREAAALNVGPLNADILEFCEANFGKQVGDGECAALAGDAINLVHAQKPPNNGKWYVWGRELKPGQPVLPGDIVQLEDCKWRTSAAPHHTQVIRRVLGPNRYEVLQQHVNGTRIVVTGELNMNTLLEGAVKIYRPLPR
jgi:hypothetical protein